MRAFRGFAIPALAGLLFFGTPSVLQAQPGQGSGAEQDSSIIEGRIEEAGVNGILVNGRYYFIDDTVIEDGSMNRLGRDALRVGSEVILYLHEGKLAVILVRKVPEK